MRFLLLGAVDSFILSIFVAQLDFTVGVIHSPMWNLNYPLGIQNFEKLRDAGLLYIDKTRFVYELVCRPGYYFLARPRRFGKSLFLSTIKACCEGKKHLFSGLEIESLMPGDWPRRPVLYLDFVSGDFDSSEAVAEVLDKTLSRWETEYGVTVSSGSFARRMETVIRRASETSGQKVVILVDEYDRPLTSNYDHPEIMEEILEQLYGFYSVFKGMDEYIHMGMLTGVTKFGKLSIFSGLNNLHDISLNETFAGVCGVTDEELHSYLTPGIEEFAEKRSLTIGETFGRLKAYYDGYHFSENLLDIYNPYSLMSALAEKRLGDFWFESGTPTLLFQAIRRHQAVLSDIPGSSVAPGRLTGSPMDGTSIIPLLYQSGYLTIRSYDSQSDRFTLDFPNIEVKKGFFECLLPALSGHSDESADSFINKVCSALKRGDAESFVGELKSYLADIPYDLRRDIGRYESYYQNLFYSIVKMLGFKVEAEYHTSAGSIDILIKTDQFVYIVELKLRGSARDVIRQIEERGYALPFETDGRKSIRIGLSFSMSTHTVEDCIVEEGGQL